mgnify:CR=1 FL=1
MRDSNSKTINGLFSTLLTITFIVLKLCHVIDWSWVWVLAPIWIPLALALLFLGVVLIVKR